MHFAELKMLGQQAK